MPIAKSTLPYDYAALEPHISKRTLEFHHDRHHNGYIDKLNTLIEGTPYENMPLEEIIVRSRSEARMDIFVNAAQAWNHSFLWQSMSPSGETRPEGRLKRLIEEAYGSVDRFKTVFADAATSLTGSGWVWLVEAGGELRILTTSNADTAVGTPVDPLLVLDVWEHAYYLDYQNARADYVATFLDQLINWKFAAANLKRERTRQAA